ncbi:ABC-type nitrate/sulfonate/bicarbonate transport system ATPase subunit [Enterococcus sp. PF1-24]|uniref:ABC transporter ATP-binding protein n=1 Tax=unclassified Enterococcus TaxID=2608891 RepID=UPI002473976C|nr:MULTISPECIES: ABC transporter ATP-binding protein [unclassified Enterococcus]MDH6365572.1 ABC-type nitrate/sulfonate/bicarbonate transport system ATPase subunit [Enterococcus sp. PFB1-1]MDH6402674.1 ABC-type nitrate/sulfonate/bicarbonate transport system ATPase subunit [Enterococcus sp. PF1-24]
MSKLVVKNITKEFAGKTVLNDINFQVATNEIISIIGPSGVGKSTLFNIIAGLLNPTQGEVLLDGISILNIPGKISYMLQKDLLLPFKTVAENVALPLRLKGEPKKIAQQKATALLKDFGLADLAGCFPKELSGGMRQRVALLRTYLFSANLILLDEPFSALDPFTKSEVHDWYLQAHDKLKLTTIFITHDIDEALKLSDWIYILKNQGQVTFETIHLNPQHKKQADFLLSEEFLQYKTQIMTHLA